MDKQDRLKMLREIGRKHQDKSELVFGEIPVTREDIKDEMKDMDTVTEANRETATSKINSDEG